MKIVEILSSFRADLTVIDTQGRDSASKVSIEIINWLLKEGFDPKYADRDGWTSLHWAGMRPLSASLRGLSTLS